MISTMSAVNAYKNQLKLAQGAGDTISASEQDGGGPSFSKLLASEMQDVVNTQKVAESAQVDAITGKGDITDLVTAISNAEMALNTIVTVRDRAISAYQDIIRMPI